MTKLKRVVCASTLAAGVGVAGLFGIGLGAANAQPGPPCNAPGAPPCGGNNNNDWQHRGIDQGRRDHQPFVYNGQRVQPMPAGNGAGWGFWFLGQWIPL
jgi:hypothetical protein